ncbi:MAG: lipid-A-disaccharide synthase [Bdellovibrionia bacterium]
MKILISAAETSSDQHGAQLLRALQRECAQRGESLEAFGIGGPALQQAGLRILVDARSLLVMGFTEVLSRLPTIFAALKTVTRSAAQEKPDVAVVIDYPDFHFRLAKRLKRQGVPVIYFIPPKIWAWRKGRIKILRERFVRVLSILPFEVDFYRREKMPVSYVGNPLVDELPLKLTRSEARQHLGLTEKCPVFVMMPGSRPNELKYHLDLMLGAALLASQRIQKEQGERLVALLPLPQTSEIGLIEKRINEWKARHPDHASTLDLRLSQGNAHECMVAADAGLIKSGTSTLEAGVLGCVHSIMYRTNKLTHFIFDHLIRYKGPVGLVNLVAGWTEGKPLLIREIIHHHQTEEELSEELLSIYQDQERRARIQEGLARVRQIVVGENEGKSPSEVAAREIIEWVRSSPAR